MGLEPDFPELGARRTINRMKIAMQMMSPMTQLATMQGESLHILDTLALNPLASFSSFSATEKGAVVETIRGLASSSFVTIEDIEFQSQAVELCASGFMQSAPTSHTPAHTRANKRLMLLFSISKQFQHINYINS